jgi:exopolyphosphatase/guanosine-5'-triphosphate,3'-diphosphate pyrophosphatase
MPESTSIKPVDGRVVAFIDIGTNSLRLLLVRINPNQSYTVLSDQKEVVRLGEGEFVEQHLQLEAMQRAALVSRGFADMARLNGAEEIIAVATSATREAENRDEFLRLLKHEAKLDVHVVSGREEARLIYLGVSNSVHLGEKKALFIDIGGGSTEVVVGSQAGYDHLDSLKLGAIRLTSLFFVPDESGPVSPERYAVIQQYVRNTAVRTVQAISQYSLDFIVGSSGTIENLADIAVQRFSKRRRQREDTVKFSQLQQVIEHLCSLPLEERRRVPGINPERADIIIPGGAIIETLMHDLGIQELRVSDRGLRDGLLVDYLSRHVETAELQKTSVRARSVLQLGRACHFDEGHARHVANLALQLYDSGAQAGLYSLDGWERELLEYAAQIHDVGMFLAYSNHHEHSYYLIRNADLLGFDQREIAIMANAALFHRKAMPSKKKHPEFAGLDRRAQKVAELFALILRIAESLDRSHTGAIHTARLQPGKGGEIILEVKGEGDYQLELWGVQAYTGDFEEVFGRKLAIKDLGKS